jgi:hypothetical protein
MTSPFEDHMEISASYLKRRLGVSDTVWKMMETAKGRNIIRKWWNETYGTSVPMEKEQPR